MKLFSEKPVFGFGSKSVLTTIFLFFVVFISANIGVLYSNIVQLGNHEKWVLHTYSVVMQVERVISTVKDAETGQRGYLLTGNLGYLTPYNDAILEVPAHLGRLENLVSDNPDQRTNAKMLQDLVDKRLEMLRMNISLFESNQGRFPRGVNLHDGRALMEALRRQTDKMIEIEDGFLRKRIQVAEEGRQSISSAFLLAAGLNALLLFVAYFYALRHFRRQGELIRQREKDAWIRSTQAEIAEAVSGEPVVARLAKKVLQRLSERLGIQRGSFYVADKGSLHFLEGFASDIAVNDNAKPLQTPRHIAFGQSLVGEAALASKVMHIRDVPAQHFSIVSSTGASQPAELLLIPLIFENTIQGVIEVASFQAFSEVHLEVAEGIREIVAVGLNAAQSRARLQELYEETHRQSEELQSQQEELRVTNEELVEQTKILSQSRVRLQTQQEELSQTNEELEQQARILEAQKGHLAEKNRDLNQSRLELEKKARDLQVASQYKSEFLAKMSHELRTPLNSLLILATLLGENKEGNLSDQQLNFARTIQSAGNDLLQLINDILDLSKLEARKLEMHPEEFSASALCDSLKRSFEPLAQSRNIDFRIELDTNLPKLNTDRQRLEQILRNFLSNALKFTEKGSVTLKIMASSKTKDFVEFEVRDTGIGIPEPKQRLIFEAFEQVDGSISRNYGGTGLGLTISRELAHLLGGRIGVSSVQGKGSEFSLEIPSSLPETAPEQVPVVQDLHPPLQAPRSEESLHVDAVPRPVWGEVPDEAAILIVEDDADFGETLATLAKDFGFETVRVESGEAALELLKDHQPRAVLLDIKLPGISGLSVLEKIKSNLATRHIPTQIISGLDYSKNAMKLGAIGYLLKPASKEKINEALRRIDGLISREVKKILVVEDDPMQREAIRQLIAGENIEIVTVGSGVEAIKAVKENIFECMILDLTLSDISGFQLLEKLRIDTETRCPPVIVYTGKDLSREEEQKLREYSDSIVVKGVRSPERLLDEVSLFLHRVESDIPEEKRVILHKLRNQEQVFEGRRILVVDDDLRNVFALTSALEGAGLQVLIGRNGIEALESIKANPSIDLVLMDIMMPQMDGYEAMEKIRALGGSFKKIPIIALTAKAMKGDHERCLQAGATDYLPKPIDLNNLFSLLRVWLPVSGTV